MKAKISFAFMNHVMLGLTSLDLMASGLVRNKPQNEAGLPMQL